ncbi:pentatricopeptide repeat (PPR) superfamily protein [Artemisia annua]|uniref:Pentatricopeptide repeat (PPR) superfamily protein n=1 Tax=Artemisia annua TaxID=35608 RepID=A0A2U1Q0F3_ARTAN|nr:pentatricopeptide repeat (PPR) superfamily protein [Artemisia annua]
MVITALQIHFNKLCLVTQPPVIASRKKVIWHVVKCSNNRQLIKLNALEGKIAKKPSKTEHHLWNKRDSAASGQKALNLVRIVCGLPNEKEAVYGELDKWTAWESEFPVIAVAKALNILKQRKQWKRVIQVAKWMFGKGQGMTMGTFDTLLVAFDMDQRVDEAQSLWNMILHTHERSISKRLFSRMISIYAHHNMPANVIEVFADMEELGVKPDEDTTRKVARAFQEVGEEEKQKLVLKKYLSEWKYIHFKGERVRVKRYALNE